MVTLSGHTDVSKKQPSRKPAVARTKVAEVPAASSAKIPNRTVAVFVSLVGMIAFTSVLLVVLAPPPLRTEAWKSLFAIDTPESLDGVFATDVPTEPGRWNYIYIHHSRTPGGDAVTLAKDQQLSDHFVIGNGDGCVDGEIQMTQNWNRQESITHPPSGAALDPHCISICLVGDFDTTRPTPTQERRLVQLVGTLQAKLHIPAPEVLLYDQPGSVVGIGHSFPRSAFLTQVLP
jgi:hypothetical protein